MFLHYQKQNKKKTKQKHFGVTQVESEVTFPQQHIFLFKFYNYFPGLLLTDFHAQYINF
jgi:hypothetical protein